MTRYFSRMDSAGTLFSKGKNPVFLLFSCMNQNLIGIFMQKKINMIVCFIVLLIGCQNSHTKEEFSTPPVFTSEQIMAAQEFELYVPVSSLFLTILKDTTIPVKASLNLQKGFVNFAAQSAPFAEATIDLNTFNSELGVRDMRVKDIFFQTQKDSFKTTTIKILQLPENLITQLRQQKQVSRVSLDSELVFRQKSQKISFVADISFTEKGRLLVKSAEPVKIKISEWDLSANLKQLIEICNHRNINDLVTIDVSLEFLPVVKK